MQQEGPELNRGRPQDEENVSLVDRIEQPS
jgi:hypothetical protein